MASSKKTKYLQNIRNFQKELEDCVWNILKTYGRSLVLRLEEYNLLQNQKNCIESSTAIGFAIEEFLVSKLEMYTHCGNSKYRIDRFVGSTSSKSFDCFSLKNGMKFLVNIKLEKKEDSNTAVAAIDQLWQDYCNEEPDVQKSFILLKVRYSIKDEQKSDFGATEKPRSIYIEDLSTFCFETIDFSEEWEQDNRSWSKKYPGEGTKNNGRLKITALFRSTHPVRDEDVSYEKTRAQIDYIWRYNQERWLTTQTLKQILPYVSTEKYSFNCYKGSCVIENNLSLKSPGFEKLLTGNNLKYLWEPIGFGKKEWKLVRDNDDKNEKLAKEL